MTTEILHKYSIIDLTHNLSEETPIWPNTVMPFTRNLLEDYHKGGYRCFSFSQSEGVGTHIDSPMHFSKNGRSISDLKCEELVGLAIIIDVREKVDLNCDYQISISDINELEDKYGIIPEQSIVLGLTGWDKHWSNSSCYLNQDNNGIMHFPGFSKEAAELLVIREIAGIGIDALSIDAGASIGLDAHHVILGNNKYQIENLTNLDKLPKKGAILFALPIKILGGAEAPARVIALIPSA